jgi:hypothetical protein
MKKYLISGILLLKCHATSLPMASFAQCFNKYAGHIATGLSFFPWALQSFGYFTGLHDSSINEQGNIVALGTDRYVRDVLSQFGYDRQFVDALKIRTIKKNDDIKKSPFYTDDYNYEKPLSYGAWQNSTNNGRLIFVPNQLDVAVKNYYQEKLTKTDKRLLKLTLFQVVHAAEQIAQNHDKKRAFAFLWVPLLVHVAAQKCGQLGNALGAKIVPTELAEKTMLQNATQIAKGILKVAVGLPAKLFASTMGILAYYQYLQKGADEVAAQKMKNNPGILKAGIRYYQNLDKKVRNDFLKYENMIYNPDFSFFNHPYHRAPYYRSQTLQKVLDEVKKDK